jgi:hypothetical protein
MSVAVLALLASTDASADDRQFRQLKLADGRGLTVEILSTEPGGLLVQLPQGRTLVSFELLIDMVPIDQATWDNQTPWIVYVDLPAAQHEDVVELLSTIPNLSVHPLTEPVGGVTAAMAAEAAGCGRKIECVVSAIASTPWKVVITGETKGSGLVLRSKVSSATSPAEEVTLADAERGTLWNGLHDALGLDRPAQGPPRAATEERDGDTFDGKRVVALSFVPFPGVPSLAQKDSSGVALALGVVVPSTALWVGAVGQTGQSAPEFVGLSVAGYYVLTVLANQVTGFRSLDEEARVGITAAPTPGGATVRIAGSL